MNNEIALRPSYWASVSGGKDSLYMLNYILNNLDRYPLDGVVHFELEIDWEWVIKNGFNKCMRVLRPNGTLIFKWSEIDIPVSKIIKVIDTEPLFGHKSGKLNKTHRLCFMKKEHENIKKRWEQ